MIGQRVARKRGKDVIITLLGSDMEPPAVSVEGAIRKDDLEREYGSTVFVRNNNLQDLPAKLRGCLIWQGAEGIVGIVISSNGN